MFFNLIIKPNGAGAGTWTARTSSWQTRARQGQAGAHKKGERARRRPKSVYAQPDTADPKKVNRKPGEALVGGGDPVAILELSDRLYCKYTHSCACVFADLL